jgi:hypothetical protein
MATFGNGTWAASVGLAPLRVGPLTSLSTVLAVMLTRSATSAMALLPPGYELQLLPGRPDLEPNGAWGVSLSSAQPGVLVDVAWEASPNRQRPTPPEPQAPALLRADRLISWDEDEGNGS